MATWNDEAKRNERFQQVLDQKARGEHSGKRPDPDRPRSHYTPSLAADDSLRIAAEAAILDIIAQGPITRNDLYVVLRRSLRTPFWLYSQRHFHSIVNDLVTSGRVLADLSLPQESQS